MNQKAEVEKLLQEKQELIACAEELELEASRNHRALTAELRELKMANKELKGKYEFSESHYQMTLRHANNLQSFLDARDQELGQLREIQNNQAGELEQLRRQKEALQSALNTCKEELNWARSYAEETKKTVQMQVEELSQLHQQLEHANALLEMRQDELMQTQRHADNLQQLLENWQNELVLARRHGENLQQLLDAQAQSNNRSRLYRVKERIRGWFR